MAAIAERLGDSVCAILPAPAAPSTEPAQDEPEREESFRERWWRQHGGGGMSADASSDGAFGSGLVVDERHVVTTNGLVESGARRALVVLRDGRRLIAVVVARDPLDDICLLRVDPGERPLTPALLGTSAGVRPGQLAITLGNPFETITRDRRVAASTGVVSGVYLSFEGRGRYRGLVLETDAAVNPGSFGGPLVDAQGRVIGIVSSLYASNRWLGTAVPIDQVVLALEDLREGREPRSSLGATLQPPPGGGRGAMIASIRRDGAAREAGLRAGDTIVAIEGRPAPDATTLERALDRLPPGTPLAFRVRRGDEFVTATVRLGRAPSRN